MTDKNNHRRDIDGRVRQADVDDLLEDPQGTDLVREDVRIGGAIADVGPNAGRKAAEIGELIEMNRDDVGRVTGRQTGARGAGNRKRGGRR